MGKVYLVGAGPGDPELITRRGEALLRQADCVIYDRLVSPELLRRVKPGAELLYVGKESDERGRGEARIRRLLVEKARGKRVVVRLKGGDPTIFGRLSDELAPLARRGIPFEVIPGVSSVWAAAASAGIPLTDRKLSSSVAIATGHPAAEKARVVRWEKLGESADTLVILMGRLMLPQIVRRLRRVRPASEPMALIRWASTPRQEVLITTLGSVLADLKGRPFMPPLVILVGKVVGLADQRRVPGLRPGTLQGRRIVLTRPADDQPELSMRLQQLGATCVSLPTIEIRPRALSSGERRRLLEGLCRYDWVLFNSRHGVEALQRLARRAGRRPPALRAARPGGLPALIRGRICAIGPRTQAAVEAAGLKPDLIPAEFSTEGVRKAFGKIPIRGARILIPRSQRAVGDDLARALRRKGARVDEVAMYETVIRRIPARQLKQALRRSDAVTFTSASTAEGFLKAARSARMGPRSVTRGVEVVAIGPATARALKSAGLRGITMPRRSWTVEGLVEALVERLGRSVRPEHSRRTNGHGSTGSP